MPDSDDSLTSIASIVTDTPVLLQSQRRLSELQAFALKCPHRTVWSDPMKLILPVWCGIRIKMKKTQNRLGGDITYVMISECDADSPLQPASLLLSVDGLCLTEKNAMAIADRYPGRQNVEITYQVPRNVAATQGSRRPPPPPVTLTRPMSVQPPPPPGTVDILSIELQSRELASALAHAALEDMAYDPVRRVVIQYLGDSVEWTAAALRPPSLLGIPAHSDEISLVRQKSFCRLYSTHLLASSDGRTIYKRNDAHCLPRDRNGDGSVGVTGTSGVASVRLGCPIIDTEVVQRTAHHLLDGYKLARAYPDLAAYLLIAKDWLCGSLSSKDVGIFLRNGGAGSGSYISGPGSPSAGGGVRLVHVDVLAIDDHELVGTYASALYCSTAVYTVVFGAHELPHLGARLVETLSEIAAACCSPSLAADSFTTASAPESPGVSGIDRRSHRSGISNEPPAPAVVLYAHGADSMKPQKVHELDRQLTAILQPFLDTELGRRLRLLWLPPNSADGCASPADIARPPSWSQLPTVPVAAGSPQPEVGGGGGAPSFGERRLIHASCPEVARAVTAELLAVPRHEGLAPPRRHKLACTLMAKMLHGRRGCLSRSQLLDLLREAVPSFAGLNPILQDDVERDVLAYLHESGLALVPEEMGLTTVDPGRGVDGFVLLQPLDLLDFVEACSSAASHRRELLAGPSAAIAQAWREFEAAGVLRRLLFDTLLKRDDRPHLLHFYERLHVMLPLSEGAHVVPNHCPLLHQPLDGFNGPVLLVDFGHCLPARLLTHLLWRLQRECDPLPASADCPALPHVDYAILCGAYLMQGSCFLLRPADRPYGRLEIRLRGCSWDAAELINVYSRLLQALRRILPVKFRLGPPCPLLVDGRCVGPQHHMIDLSNAGPCGQIVLCGRTRVDLEARVSRWLYSDTLGVPDIPDEMNRVLLRNIPEAVTFVICNGLNTQNVLHRNWRRLAAELDIYTSADVEKIGAQNDPTRCIIKDLAERQPHRTVAYLLGIVQRRLERNDIIEDVRHLLERARLFGPIVVTRAEP